MENLPCKLAFQLRGHQGPVRAVRFNKKGSYCLTCGSDKSVQLWNPHKGLRIKVYQGHGAEVFDAAASDDNSRIVSGGSDNTVFLVDVGTGQSIRRFRGHISRINCVKFNEEATLIVSGSYDATVRMWDCRTRTYDAVQVLKEAKDSVTSLQLHGPEILAGSVDGNIRRYDVRFGKLFSDTVGHPVTSVSFSRDGHCVLASSLDGVVRLFDKDNGELLNDYKGHKNSDYKVDNSLSHDDAHVISGSEDGKICFWDLVEGNLIRSLEHEKTTAQLGRAKTCVVYSLSYHCKEPCLLSAGSHGPVLVWKGPDWSPEQQPDDVQ